MSRALPWVANTCEEARKILGRWQRLGKTRRLKNNFAGPPTKKVARALAKLEVKEVS